MKIPSCSGVETIHKYIYYVLVALTVIFKIIAYSIHTVKFKYTQDIKNYYMSNISAGPAPIDIYAEVLTYFDDFTYYIYIAIMGIYTMTMIYNYFEKRKWPATIIMFSLIIPLNVLFIALFINNNFNISDIVIFAYKEEDQNGLTIAKLRHVINYAYLVIICAILSFVSFMCSIPFLQSIRKQDPALQEYDEL